MQLIRKRLSETEGTPPNTRYNPECDCVEVTTDGGATWTEDEGSDPRVNPAFQRPPNTEPDVKCAAAAGMVKYVEDAVDSAIDTTTVIGLANGIFAIIIAFLPITILAAVVLAVAEFLISLGAAALIAAFTSGVYTQLRCILYCFVDADGFLTDDTLSQAQAKIASEIGDPVVDAVFSILVSPTGVVGLNNAGSQLADGAADCSSCDDCVTYFCIEILSPVQGLSPVTNCTGNPNTWYNSFQCALNEFGSVGIFQIDHLEMDVQYSGVGFPVGGAYFAHSQLNCSPDYVWDTQPAAAGLVQYVYDPVDGYANINRVFFGAACSNNEANSAGNILAIRRIKIMGHSLYQVPDLLYLYDDYRCD